MKKLIYFTTILLFFAMAGFSLGSDNSKPVASCDSYFDTATGHRYVKNSETTYAEYSQRGKLLRTDVPNTQPHLCTSGRIVEIDPDCYVIYKKRQNGEILEQVLPVSSKHPEGWRCKKVLTVMKHPSNPKK